MQRTNFRQIHSYFASLVSPSKLVVSVLFLLVSLSIEVSAQNYIACDQITNSPRDTIKFERVSGKPGDTVWVPVYVKTDSTMSGFVFLIKWDANKIDPYQLYDPINQITYIHSKLTGRFLKLNPQNPNDTTTNFFSQISQNPFDSNGIICGYNLSVTSDSTISTTPPGSGVIFLIGFRLFGTLQHNDSALVRFYQVQPVFLPPPPAPPILLDCRRSEISADWNNSGAPVTLYPTPVNGYIVADTAPEPTIVLFSPQSDTIQAGAGTALNYQVSNTDSLRIVGPSVNFKPSGSGPNFTGFVVITPAATSSYVLTAYNANGVSVDTTRVVVKTGGGGNPNAPNISFPDGNSFTVEQGQTVTFKVRATDPDVGNIVTLRASSLPSNAAFAQVVGTTTVEGNFSFTPDINQEGLFPITFIATDNTGASNSATANVTVEALKFDRLFSTSATGQSPVGGLAGKKDIVFPINLVTSQTVYGIQFDMTYDHDALKIDSFVVTPRTQDYVIYDDIGGTPGQIRVVTFGLANDSIVTDSASTAILNAYVSIDSDAVVWTDYVMDLFNGWESIDPNPAFPSLPLVTNPGIVQVDNPGDVNLDKRIDVADLVNIVAFIIGNFGLTQRQFETADLIRNDTVDVFDLVGTINKIFGIPVSPVPPPPITNEPAVLSLAYNDLYAGQSDLMIVKSDLPERVAAAELNFKYDPTVMALGAPQLGADAKNMALQYKFDGKGNVKVLIHFTNPFNASQQMPIGTNIEMLKFPMLASRIVESGNKNQVKISKALLSTSDAASIAVQGFDDQPLLPETFELFQNYPNPFNPTTTIEFTIGTPKDGALTQPANLDIYNILGQRVTSLVNDDLLSGHYRVEWNSTNSGGQRVATGVYFYRMVVGSESQTKKMLLIK